MQRKNVVVVGSYNAGLFFRGEAIPAVAETVIGAEFYEGGGGKGSNQALAARRMGAQTQFVGRVGADRYGEDALRLYAQAGVDTAGVRVDERAHTGMSVILIDGQGRNSIMVVPGSNYLLSDADMEAAAPLFASARLVGFQLENRPETVCRGLKLAHELGAETLLDPAPAARLPEEIYPYVTYVKPNEVEAQTITGIPVTDAESARRAGEWFVQRGVCHAIVTLGSGGAVLTDANGSKHYSVPPLPSPVLDTTGAGDCFSGVLMAMLAEEKSLDEAIRIAICASALSTTRLGVVEALPDRKSALAFFEEVGR